MLKNILIGVVVLGILVMIYLGAATYFVAQDMLAEKEPQLRQYMQMTEEQQNEWIQTHADEIFELMQAKPDDPAVDKERLEIFKKANTDPAVQKALVQFGRSAVAMAIVHSNALVQDMSDAVKSKYTAEAEEFEKRFEIYANTAKAVEPRLNEK